MSRRRWLSCPESRVLYIDLRGAIKSLTASYTDAALDTLPEGMGISARAWRFSCFFFSLVCRVVFSGPLSAARGHRPCLRESWFIHLPVQPHACHRPGISAPRR